MSDSIFDTIKESLGVDVENAEYDTELKMFVNSALSTLTQLGVGPKAGFMVTSKEDRWVEFIGLDNRLNAVKTYVHLRCKMLFDPPAQGFVVTAIKEQIEELEWRLNVTVDNVIEPTVLVPPETIFDGGTP